MTKRPFLFDTHFPGDNVLDVAPAAPEPAFQTGGFTEEDLAAVRDRAYRQGMDLGERDGFERGQQAAQQSAQAQHAQALTSIDASLRTALAGLSAFHRRLEHDAVRVVTALVARLAPPLLDAAADAELDLLVRDILRAAIGRPRLEIRLAPASLEPIRAEIETMAAESGFRGDVHLVADAALPAGGAIADWGTGGAEHDPRALERALGDAIAIAISRLTLGSRSSR